MDLFVVFRSSSFMCNQCSQKFIINMTLAEVLLLAAYPERVHFDQPQFDA